MARQLFAALLPLILFWAIEEFYGLKEALIAGCIAAVAELTWERVRQGKISFLTATSNALVLGLGAVSFWLDSGIAFKLQPMIMELGMAVFMASMRFRGGEPFMVRTLRDAPMLDAERRKAALSQPWIIGRMSRMDTVFIAFLVCHGLAVGGAAIWGSTRLWILLKGVVFYLLLVGVMLPFLRKPRVPRT